MTCIGSGYCGTCDGTGEMAVQSLGFFTDGNDREVFVHCSSTWYAETDVDWIEFSQSSGYGNSAVTLTAEANPTTSTREGVVTVTCGSAQQTFIIYQTEQSVRLTAEPTAVVLTSSGTSKTFKISSNTSWTISCEDPWVTCSPSSGSGDATISVRASAYTQGTRYATLTITDDSGEESVEVQVTQATNAADLTFLKNLLEKPMGILDVDLKTASYYEIKSAVSQSYQIGYESSTYKTFIVYASENPSLENLTYQGLKLNSFHVDKSSLSEYYYYFSLPKSQESNDYESYLNNILQDFKYNLNVTLVQSENPGKTVVAYSGYGADKNYYFLRVWDYTNSYSFDFGVFYE